MPNNLAIIMLDSLTTAPLLAAIVLVSATAFLRWFANLSAPRRRDVIRLVRALRRR